MQTQQKQENYRDKNTDLFKKLVARKTLVIHKNELTFIEERLLNFLIDQKEETLKLITHNYPGIKKNTTNS